MGDNAKALTGYADGLFGAENFPIKFTFAGGFGFLVYPTYPADSLFWPYEGNMLENTTAMGWGPPFKLENSLINGGVGTIAKKATQDATLVRMTSKVDNQIVGISRGISHSTSSALCVDWKSADFSTILQWRGPIGRYGIDDYSFLGRDNNSWNQKLHHVGQIVLARFGTIPAYRVEDFTNPGDYHESNSRIPLVVTRPHIRGFDGSSESLQWWGYFYYFEATLPDWLDHLYHDKLYINGALAATSPEQNNRTTFSPDDFNFTVGRPAMLYGSGIRQCAPDVDYYTAMGLLDEYNKMVAAGTKEDWVTIVTHEWWQRDATTNMLDYLFDRVYTAPLRFLQAAAKAGNPMLGSEITQPQLIALYNDVEAAPSKENRDAYLGGYRKWRKIGERDAPVVGSLPDSNTWYFSTDNRILAPLIYRSQGEHMSFHPWLFNQSGTEAIQHRHYRDSGTTILDKADLENMLVTLSLSPEIWSTVTWSTVDTSAYMASSGGAFMAVDYRGDVLTIVSAVLDTDTWTLDVPWRDLPILFQFNDGDDFFCRYVSCLDIRYEFMAYGEFDFPGGGNLVYTHKDYYTIGNADPISIGAQYTGDWNNIEGFYENSTKYSFISGCTPNKIQFLSEGSSVVHLRADTWIFSHELGKWAVPSSHEAVAYLTNMEDTDAETYRQVVDFRGLRIFYSAVYVNGAYAGTLPQITNSYAPYTADDEMQYCTVSLG